MPPSLLRDWPTSSTSAHGDRLQVPCIVTPCTRSLDLPNRGYRMQRRAPICRSWHGTTILTVRKGGKVVIAGDGQVSVGQTVIKHNAKKVRPIGKGGVIAGFAGATADAFTLFGRLEGETRRSTRPAHARLRRTRQGLADRQVPPPSRGDDDRRRRQEVSLVLTGTGDVLEPEAGVLGDRLRRQLRACRGPRPARWPARCRRRS